MANPVRRYYLYPISNKSHRAILNEDENKTSSDVNKFLNYLQGFDKKASYPVRNKYKRFKANWWKDFFRKNPCYKLRNYEWMPYSKYYFIIILLQIFILSHTVRGSIAFVLFHILSLKLLATSP